MPKSATTSNPPGGTDAEVDCFAKALGARIEQLREAAADGNCVWYSV